MLKLLSYNNDASPNITFSTSLGNFISITGFLYKLYLASFVINVAINVTSFCILFVNSVLSNPKSIFVSASFISSSLLFVVLYTSCFSSLSSFVSSSIFFSLSTHVISSVTFIFLLSIFVILSFICFVFSIAISPSSTGLLIFTTISDISSYVISTFPFSSASVSLFTSPNTSPFVFCIWIFPSSPNLLKISFLFIFVLLYTTSSVSSSFSLLFTKLFLDFISISSAISL